MIKEEIIFFISKCGGTRNLRKQFTQSVLLNTSKTVTSPDGAIHVAIKMLRRYFSPRLYYLIQAIFFRDALHLKSVIS